MDAALKKSAGFLSYTSLGGRVRAGRRGGGGGEGGGGERKLHEAVCIKH
jgi:hypothetical protein